MSLLIFPLSFTNSVPFPIKQTPQFNTITQLSASGRGDIRISTRQFPLWNFVIDIGCLRGDNQGVNTAWQILMNFYMAVQGAQADWLFLHPFDNTVAAMQIGVGDGTTLAFSIIRTLVVGGAQDLVQNFVNPPAIFVNGVLQSGVNYAIDQYGTLTFTPGHAPPLGQSVTWSGQFYYRCHFLEDEWADLAEEYYQIWTYSGLKFRSVLL